MGTVAAWILFGTSAVASVCMVLVVIGGWRKDD